MLTVATRVRNVAPYSFITPQLCKLTLPTQCIRFTSRFYSNTSCVHKAQAYYWLQHQNISLPFSPMLLNIRSVTSSSTRNTTESTHNNWSNSSNNDDKGTAPDGNYDPWKVLGLKPGVSAHMLRIRYHELMKEVHPELCENGVGDLHRLADINKAYELVSRSPTLDRRYRNLITDQQYFYYRYVPEWMAKNIDEMPRYCSWMRWRFSAVFNVAVLGMICYFTGALITKLPIMTSIFLLSVMCDILLHTMLAPLVGVVTLMYGIVYYRSRNLSWLTSPKNFLMRELSY